MEIVVTRFMCGATCTIGELLLDGVHECWTLEDVVRPNGVKVKGETAIPYGRYRVVITFSNRFGRDMPLLLNVPNFEGIRIHSGNVSADTEGCLLVGRSHTSTSVLESRAAFDALYPKLWDAIERGEEVWITFNGGSQ